MNVTLVSRYFNPRNGGVGTVSEATLETLKLDKNINVKTFSMDNSILSFEGDVNRFHHLDYLFFSLLETPIKIRSKLYGNTDVFHALSPIEALYLNKSKTVVTVHDLMLMTMPKMIHTGVFAKSYGYYFKKTLNKAIKSKEIIAISDESADALANHYNLNVEDLHVVRDPLRKDLYPMKNKPLNTDDKFTIGTIAHLNKRKRVNLLLEAFLKADIKNSQLLIVGTGNQLDYLKKMAKGDKRVKFLGFVPDEDLNGFYNSLDIFVYPSLMEGYGLPIVEAMACSVPSITLNDAYIPKDLKTRTVQTSRENLSNVLNEKFFDVDIKSNLEFVKEHSHETIGKQLNNIYKMVLE
jgi:glycosyltransferase involved in cell wall biosynthesis